MHHPIQDDSHQNVNDVTWQITGEVGRVVGKQLCPHYPQVPQTHDKVQHYIHHMVQNLHSCAPTREVSVDEAVQDHHGHVLGQGLGPCQVADHDLGHALGPGLVHPTDEIVHGEGEGIAAG